MANLYWYSDGVDPNWTTILNNWWSDSDHTIAAGAIPTSDDAVILGGVYVPRIALDDPAWVCPSSIDGTGLDPVDAASGPIFLSDSAPISVACSILGNAFFGSQAVNGMLVSGMASFAGQASNAGTVGEASFSGDSTNGVSGQVSGDAAFTDAAVNNGAVNGDATFNLTSRHNGNVNGTADFYNDSSSYGTVSGHPTFHDSSINSGTLSFADFADSSRNQGTVGDEYSPVVCVFSLSSGNYGTVNGEVHFIDNAQNNGTINCTVSGTASFEGSAQHNSSIYGSANFSGDTTCTGSVSVVATFTDNAANRYAGLNNPIFSGHSINYESVNGATFNDTADNEGNMIGLAVFNGSSINNSSVFGSAEFHDSANNNGTVGSATFDGTSSNNMEVSGNATFGSGTINNGNVGGQASFADGSTNAGEVMGSAEFHGTSINSGSVAGNAVYWDTSSNPGTMGGTAQLMWATNQTAILSGSTWGSAAHVVDADGSEILHWQFINGSILAGTLAVPDNGSLSFEDGCSMNGAIEVGLNTVVDNQTSNGIFVNLLLQVGSSSTLAATVDYPAVSDVKAGVPFANGHEGTLPDGGGGGGVNRPNRAGGLWF